MKGRTPNDEIEKAENEPEVSDIQRQARYQIVGSAPVLLSGNRSDNVVIDKDDRGADRSNHITDEDGMMRDTRPDIAPPKRAVRPKVGQHPHDPSPDLDGLLEGSAATVFDNVAQPAPHEDGHRQTADGIEGYDAGRSEGPKDLACLHRFLNVLLDGIPMATVSPVCSDNLNLRTLVPERRERGRSPDLPLANERQRMLRMR